MILVNVQPSIFTKRFYDKGLNLLTEEQAAAKCSIATHELSKMRERGEGPNCLCFEGTDFSWLYPLDTLRNGSSSIARSSAQQKSLVASSKRCLTAR